jgi:hypothetical protein
MRSATPFLGLINSLAHNAEPVWDQISPIMNQLDDICHSYGLVEGNIYNLHHTPKSGIPYAPFLAKRQTYALFAAAHDNIVEIGFNAGHSSVLALTVNPNLKYTAVDIGHHPYTQPCFDYLKSIFGDRIDLVIGNSRDIMPKLYQHRPELEGQVEGWIIDGGHGIDIASCDIDNVINLSKQNDSLLFDDTDIQLLSWLVRFYQLQGTLVPLTNLPDSRGHLFYKIEKSIP